MATACRSPYYLYLYTENIIFLYAMTLEQLNDHLEGTLTEGPIQTLNELQQQVIARIKKGGDGVFVAPALTGKTTAIALASLIKAPHSYEGSPRVIILTSTVDRAHILHKQLSTWVRRTEISIELAHDKGNMVLERNNIFDGADILVANTKRALDLYIQNGIHVGQLMLFVIDDADVITRDAIMLQRIMRFAESLPKCQRLVFTSEVTPRVEKLMEDFCLNPVLVRMDDALQYEQ